MNNTEINSLLKSGKWLIRFSDNGKSYNGFEWQPKGMWTVAPDWSSKPVCGGGLHGQNTQGHGFCYLTGSRMELCETNDIPTEIDGNKVKAPRAKIIAIDSEMPIVFCDAVGLKFKDNIPTLANLTSVSGTLHIDSKVELPNLTSVSGGPYRPRAKEEEEK